MQYIDETSLTLLTGPKRQMPFGVRLENIEAVLFDLFDTLVIIGENHQCYTKSLAKLHQSLVEKGFECSYADFEKAYIKAIEQIEAETAASLKEPHFKSYILKTLSTLGYTVDLNDNAIEEGAELFCKEFNRYIQVDPQAKALLEYLQPKYKIGLISNLSFSESARNF